MSIISDVGSTLPALLPVFAALGGAIQGAKFIQEGERGVKLRFGKVRRKRGGQPKIYEPGFAFVIPGVESLHRTHVRVRTLNLPTQEIVLSDGIEFEVGGLVQLSVNDTPQDVYAALFETNGFNITIQDYVSGQMREVLAALTYEKVLAREQIIEQVADRIREQLARWGAKLIEFTLTDCSPTPTSARAILIGAETRLRTDALVVSAVRLANETSVAALSPTVAAALIGTPVAAALDNQRNVAVTV